MTSTRLGAPGPRCSRPASTRRPSQAAGTDGPRRRPETPLGGSGKRVPAAPPSWPGQDVRERTLRRICRRAAEASFCVRDGRP
eukprot:14350350-Alexandrium_andersonii.AAC.1